MRYLFIVIFFFSNIACFAQLGQWKEIGNLGTPRFWSESKAIDDHTIMVFGGFPEAAMGNATEKCEFIDVNTNKIYPASSMNEPRARFVSLYTKDSNIIVISGGRKWFDPTSTVEMFDRKAKTWNIIGKINTGRIQCVAEFINDDEIIIVGGWLADYSVSKTAEIFNIKTGKSRFTKDFPFPINCATAIRDKNGDVLIFGGRESGANSIRSNVVYYFDSKNEIWIQHSNLAFTAFNIPATKLSNGDIILAGGITTDSPISLSNIIETDKTGNFTSVGRIKMTRCHHSITQISYNCIFIVGGYGADNIDIPETEVYNFTTGTTSIGPCLNKTRRSCNLITFGDPGKYISKIYAIGGGEYRSDDWYGTSSVETLVDFEDSPDTSSPEILSETDNCDNKEILLFFTKGFNCFNIGSCQNTTVQLLTTLPAKQIIVRVKLVDQTKSGTYGFSAGNASSGKLSEISGSLNPPNTLAVMPAAGSPELVIDSTVFWGMACAAVSVKNLTDAPVTLDNAYCLYNRAFSVPQSQLPLSIAAHDSVLLKVCYRPEKLSAERDTLVIADRCFPHFVPCVSFGVPDKFDGETRCGLEALSKTMEISHSTLKGAALYPNPASGIIRIGGIGAGAVGIRVVDIFGREVSPGSGRIISSGPGGTALDVSDLQNGRYVLSLSRGTERVNLLFTVIK